MAKTLLIGGAMFTKVCICIITIFADMVTIEWHRSWDLGNAITNWSCFGKKIDLMKKNINKYVIIFRDEQKCICKVFYCLKKDGATCKGTLQSRPILIFFFIFWCSKIIKVLYMYIYMCFCIRTIFFRSSSCFVDYVEKRIHAYYQHHDRKENRRRKKKHST